MGLIRCITGADFTAGDTVQTYADFEGRLRLAPYHNLLPDPGLFNFDEATDKHKYWNLRAARRPTHWAPYVRDENNIKQFARQVTSPLPLSTHVYDIDDMLYPGNSPVSDGKAIGLTRPAKPRTRVIRVSEDIGFPAGFITVAFGWVVNGRYTSPGPRSEPFEIGVGMGFIVATPTEIPRGASAVVFFVSEPKTSSALALTAPMYAVQREQVRRMEQYIRVVGPLNMRDKFRGVYNDPNNETYVGARGNLAGVDWNRVHSPVQQSHEAEIQLSYRIHTEIGESSSAQSTEWITIPKGKREGISYVPKSFPPGTIGWSPEIRWRLHRDGADEDDKNRNLPESNVTDWHVISRERGHESFFGRNQRAMVYGWGPDAWPEDEETGVKKTSRSETDKTGLPNPTEPVEVVELLDLNTSSLSSGKHYVKTSLFVDDEEGPASDFVTETIDHSPQAEGLRIFRPLFHQKLDNAEAREREKNDLDIPRGWIIPKPFPSNVEVKVTDEGMVRYTDTSNASTTYNAFKTTLAALSDRLRYNFRYKMDLNGWQGGKVNVYLEEYDNAIFTNDAASPTRTTLIESHTGNQEDTVNVDFIVSDTEPNRPSAIPVATTTKAVRILVQGQGGGNNGNRNFIVHFSNWGVFEGWGRPRKQNKLEWDRGDNNEAPELEHPHGGYCVIRENPQDAPEYKSYAILEKIGFENGLGSWVKTQTHTGQTFLDTSRAAALRGDYGLRSAKTATTAATCDNYVTRTLPSANMHALQFNGYIKNVSAHAIQLAHVRAADSSLMAWVRVNSAGALQVVYSNGAGVETTLALGTGYTGGERISVELKINRTAGTLRVRFGRRRHKLTTLHNISGIDWGTKEPTKFQLGLQNLATTATADVYYDMVHITDSGLDNSEAQDGNYIEYYGPDGTLVDETYGPTGVRVPVRGDADYTFSVNVWHKDCPNSTTAFRMRAMDKKHKVIHVYSPVVNITSDTEQEDWVEFSKTIHTHEDTAYVEFFANGLSHGTIRFHGMQFEKGTVAHPFDMENALNGSVSVYFATRQEGVGTFIQGDPVHELGRIDFLRDVNVVGKNEEGTSFEVEYRSANNFTALASAPYHDDFTDINVRHAIIEVKVTLESNSSLRSPEIRVIELDAARSDSHLCRADGTEYKGATLAHTIGIIHAPPRSENIELASGGIAQGPWGTRRIRRLTFTIEAYRRSTAEEIVENKNHVLYTPWARYGVTLEEAPEWETFPVSRKIMEHDDEAFQRSVATVTGFITYEDAHA